MIMTMNLFLMLLLGVYVLPCIALAFAHGQTINTTPIQAAGNLQFLPQKAYIVPLPPEGQNVSTQFGNGNDTTSIIGIIGALAGIGTGIYAKVASKKDNNITNATVMKNTNAIPELARYTFSIDPQKANALNDAPAIKLQALEDTKKDFAQQVTK